MATLNLAEGTIFAGRYKVRRCIAAGGMGAVYEVVHVETERHRALKVLLPHLVESEDMRERFRREARVAAQIQSAYIVDVFDAGIDETTQMPFLVMELLKGEELGKRLKRLGKFGGEATVGHLWQAALALDKTHRANIVHRDLKPENLFLCDEDDGPPKIKVLDFGIAKILVEGGTKANATRAMGTPLYMAPEQFRPKLKLSPATDIYALGLVAYTLLVGAPYWAEEQAAEANPYAFAALVMHGPLEPPTVRAARRGIKLPAAFDEWFAQATSSQPEKRFSKATAAIMSLASALGVPAPASPAGLGADSKEPQDARAPTGQTVPGQPLPGQIGSGPRGTIPMAVPTAGTGTEVMLGTNPSGYGLSASQPMAALEPLGTPNMGPQAKGPQRGKTLLPVIAIGAVLCAVGIGVVLFGGKTNGVVQEAATGPSASLSNAPIAPIERSAVAVQTAVSAPAVPTMDAGTQTDAGLATAKTPPVKSASSKSTSSPANKGQYIRDN